MADRTSKDGRYRAARVEFETPAPVETPPRAPAPETLPAPVAATRQTDVPVHRDSGLSALETLERFAHRSGVVVLDVTP